MKLTHGITIDENIITAKIAVSELGDSTRDASTELNQLHNFVRTIEYKLIDFSGNLKLVNNMPVITEEESNDADVETVNIPDLINKKYVLDEDLSIELTMDITKIPETEYSSNVVFNSPELLGQARATLFIEKIKSAIAEKLAEIRALANDIEKEVDVVL
ncbi:MAG: hypothetical protein NC489_22970 [Ruminococcus flavefaciens]|nr:hypothetical protein [Ruminococcus flavefaciens]